jgi:Predicted nucleic acid-binding protein, contains PIN domain
VNVVLDASAGIAAIVRRAASVGVDEVLGRTKVVIAPDLYVAEACSGIWKYVLAGQLDVDDAVGRVTETLRLVDVWHPVASFAEEALREAADHRHSVYDMFYIVLARREQATLLTLDNRMRALAQAMNIPTV